MKAANFTNFLDSGAVLRVSENNWFLLVGPFKPTNQKPPGEMADKLVLFCPNFFMKGEENYWIPESFYRVTDTDLMGLLEQVPVRDLPPMQWTPASVESFKVSFKHILDRIRDGSLRKAVPIVFEKSTESLGPARIVGVLKQLLKAPTNLYPFGFWQDGKGILGATPEVLLRQDRALLKTMALAGTCPKEDVHARVSLIDDAKERHEHDLVVQDIVQTLLNYGEVKTDGPKILELPTLFHLKTDIQCELPTGKDFPFFKACHTLHPTPALGVSPRSVGYEWMKELPEQIDRGQFGAPWGLSWGKDQALCLVAIRNIQWDKTGSRIGSGCGVVAQSELQQEWNELAQKRESVKKMLGFES